MSVLLVSLVGVGLGCGSGSSKTDGKAGQATKEEEKPRPELVTKENGAKVKAGMTLAEFEAVLGKGTKMTRDQFARQMEVSPAELPEGDYYQWGTKGRSITACFKDGKALMVARSGLE
jgi:hypothetical protein